MATRGGVTKRHIWRSGKKGKGKCTFFVGKKG